MLIKLNYNGSKSLAQAFRVVADIINNSAVTSISALRTRESGTYAADLLQSLDDANSYIYRTKDTTNVYAHMARTAVASGNNAFQLTMEFATHDASSTKQYYRLASTTAGTSPVAVTEQYASSLTSLPLSGITQWGVSLPTSQTTSQGTVPTLAGTASTAKQVASITQSLTTLWVYVTPYSMVWTAIFNNGTLQPSGWYGTNSNYASTTYTCGPNIYSQYRRYDYWNTSSNNILPFVFMNFNNTTTGFLTSINELGITNPNSTTTSECPLMMFNYINAVPGTGTSFPVGTFSRVALGVGNRYADTFALNASSNATTNPTDTTYGAVLNTSTVQTRIPSTDLLSKGFSILPLTFRNMNYNILGGNISDIGDFYLFNGDYFPGDEFSYNNRTYVIFPVGLGYTTRLGLAIPKE